MSKTNSLTAILPVLFGFFIMGFCDIVGISSDYAKSAFGWSNTMTGFIPSMVFIWFLFFSIPIGIQMNKWGRKRTVLLSMLVTVIGMAIPLLKDSVACIMGYALLGIGNAMLQVSLNPLLSNVVTDKRLLTSSLTAGQVVKAVSSFAGPFLMIFAVNVLGGGDDTKWYYVFPVLGVLTLISGLWLLLTTIPKEEAEVTTVTTKETFALLKDKTILLLFFGIFFAVGIDVSTNFISSKVMITQYNWTKEAAGAAPQVYFVCRTIGAFIGVFVCSRFSERSYFRLNIITCIIAILLLAFINDQTFSLVCIGAIGFLCSCIFPTVYSLAVQRYPNKANLISGLMITAVAGGGAVTPAIGFATDTVGITGGIFVLLICAIYLTYCAFGVKVVTKD